MGKNYLVTGGAGFIGSHVVDELLKLEDIEKIYVVDFLGEGSNLKNLSKDPKVVLIVCNIAGNNWQSRLPRIDYILHLAAESHVDRSITNPLAFIKSNVIGTANVLELAKDDKARMVCVSTDEVYGHLGPDDDPFTEETKLAPRSPYSSSKASADLIALSYNTTFGVDVSITRCCNNYGPRQHTEKLIPTVITSLKNSKKIPVYGDGRNVREWIHVTCHAKAIIEVLHTGESGEVYNVPGSCELSNLELINEIVVATKGTDAKLEDYIEFVSDRAGHDFRYSLYTKHKLDAVANQREFNLDDTIKFYA
ncbi:GDP-mannose 4,6-dehydratase [bacterium]|nr:GDP-mannose 4,6-dehydratase [bacterium]